jgi:hypothetical protein
MSQQQRDGYDLVITNGVLVGTTLAQQISLVW